MNESELSDPPASRIESSGNGPATQSWAALFLVSFLMLFLELVLIRWIGTEASIFAYLQNTILIVCFLGIGLGCLCQNRRLEFSRSYLSLAVLVFLLSFSYTRDALLDLSILLSRANDLAVWNEVESGSGLESIASIALGLVGTLVILLLVIEVFLPLGSALGRLMSAAQRPLRAYSINILGSLLGVLAFALLGLFVQPPPVWMALAGGALIALSYADPALLRPRQAVLSALLITAISCLSMKDLNAVTTLWSPYQKISVIPAPAGQSAFSYSILVNNYPFQAITQPSSTTLWNDPRILYDVPPFFRPSAENMLIVGAGTGNDVSGALRHDVKHITAVEIDPAVLQLGKALNPQPFNDPKVEPVLDDARSFFVKTKGRFDLILIAMLDSHTTGTLANARLDHYVYTRESLERVKSILTNDGVLVLSFYARRPYIADRMFRLLREVFGQDPIAFRFPLGDHASGGTMFVAGNLELVNRQLSANPELSNLIAGWKHDRPLTLLGNTPPTTDDWPYLYLEHRSIPLLFYLMAIVITAAFLVIRKRHRIEIGSSPWNKDIFAFFFMGAAFLLLEVHNISVTAAFFGSTWNVNAVIIAGILLTILLANAAVEYTPRIRVWLPAALLLVSCLALYFVPWSLFHALSPMERVWIIPSFAALPMFFSGIIFAKMFSGIKERNTAFGANLLGALGGALLQSLTFIFGTKALLLTVFLLYCAALLCWIPGKSASELN